MNLIVDGVLNRCLSGAFPPPKCFVNFTEPVGRDIGEFRVELLCLRIPELQQLALGGGLGAFVLDLLSSGYAVDYGHCHADKLHGQLCEGTHSSYGKRKQLILRKRFDGFASNPPVTLPVV